MSLPRTVCMSRSDSALMSVPPSTTEPEVMTPPRGSSRMIDRAVIVLPQPDSPTRPRHSPAATARLTPSTARTVAFFSLISVCRSLTCSTGAGPAWLAMGREPVSQAVAEHRERHDHQRYRGTGRHALPPVAVGDRLRRRADHVAPVHRRVLHAEAEPAQGGEDEDRVGDLEGHVHDDGAHRVRRDVPHD